MIAIRLSILSIMVLIATPCFAHEALSTPDDVEAVISTKTIDAAEACGTEDLNRLARTSLTVTPSQIEASDGGTFQFGLHGPGMGGRKYALLGSLSGMAPGTSLPGGLTLPLNWDWFTDLLLNMGISGHPMTVDFLGHLDVDGNAAASLIFPPYNELYEDVYINFAWCTFHPYSFVSNDVYIVWSGKVIQHGYFYDDGSAENALGLVNGGQTCWIHWFDALPTGAEICGVSTAFGCSAGGLPTAGTPAKVYVWNDPNNDGDPSDAVLLYQEDTVVTSPGTNQFHDVVFDTMTMTNGFFIGVMCGHDSGIYPAPLDESTTSSGHAWLVGDSANNFNPNDLSDNSLPPFELSSNGYNGNWLLRTLIYQ